MPLIRNEDVQWIDLAPGVRQRPIVGSHTGATGISMGEVVVAPGYRIPWHYHSVEDVILVRGGEGYVETRGTTYQVSGGTSVVIPPGVHHQVVNTGSEPLQIIFGFPTTNVDRHLVERGAG